MKRERDYGACSTLGRASRRDYNRQFVADRPTVPRGTHFVLRRNATPNDLADARERCIGATKVVGEDARYRILDIFLDDLGRLIGVGDLVVEQEQAKKET